MRRADCVDLPPVRFIVAFKVSDNEIVLGPKTAVEADFGYSRLGDDLVTDLIVYVTDRFVPSRACVTERLPQYRYLTANDIERFWVVRRGGAKPALDSDGFSNEDEVDWKAWRTNERLDQDGGVLKNEWST
jgi:hypothetical protein